MGIEKDLPACAWCSENAAHIFEVDIPVKDLNLGKALADHAIKSGPQEFSTTVQSSYVNLLAL